MSEVVESSEFGTPAISTTSAGLPTKARRRFGALPAGMLAGAVSGALFGGVFGRIFMRVIFLIDQSKRGALTDFGPAGEITSGGSFWSVRRVFVCISSRGQRYR